ncbi:fasciclin domain-containing protein [Viscerimonas tarda]
MTKMNYNLLLSLVCVAFLFIQCDDNTERNAYFERPEWLEPPIYDVLEKEGRFGLYLQCVDKTEYANVLKGAGLYTVFAPNDEAFSLWMQEKSYASVADIPDEEAKEIVAYSIVYSRWTADRLAYRFTNNQYELGAFKRKTAYYTLPYQDPEFDNNWVVDETNRSSLSYSVNDYQLNLTLQNYKYLPIYTEEYFKSFPTPLTTADYNTFYPHAVYSGKNVQDGTILSEDMYAENGIIHEVSRVNEPQENMEILLKAPQYSAYNSLLNYKSVLGEYVFKNYLDVAELSPKLLETYQKMLPHAGITKLYLKRFPSDMGLSPVMENIFSETGANDTEKSGNTLLVPDNNVLINYINTRLLKYYGKISALPQGVLYTLINTHMVKGLIWPTVYEESFNSAGEYLNGEGLTGKKFNEAGILDKQLASNGFIYRINHVIKSRYFETVYSEIYLNPGRILLNLAYTETLREELMKSPLNGYASERWTLLNFSDGLLRQDGFGYDDLNRAFTHSESGDVGNVNTRLQRLINTHIFPGLKNDEVDSEITGFSASPFTGTTNYNGWGYLVNYNGEMIRYKDNKLQAAGNIEDGTFVTVTKEEDEFNNGYVFNTDGLLQYSPRNTKSGADKYKDLPLWQYLVRARTENPNVSDFVNYVEKCLKKIDSDELDGVKSELFYTALMPANSAMANARSTGHLPALDRVSGDYPDDLAKATMFINAHFLQGTVFADDGLEYLYPVNPMSVNEALSSTLLKITNDKLNLVNKSTVVRISKYKSGSIWVLRFEPQDIRQGNLVLVDGTVGSGAVDYINGVNRGKVNAAATDNFRSNRIAGKAVLHEISNFIRFTVVE